ncbi:MAG: hypothetical protein ACRDNY_01590 [Gaiellaceae bacterium]
MRRPLALAFALVAALVVAPEAAARIEGPCTATIAGRDVITRDTGAFSDSIRIDRDDLASVTMGADEPIDRLEVELEFAGIRWTVHDLESTGNSWASEVPVADYAEYGIGLYKVVASSTGAGFTCEAAALVKVEGETLDPLTTIAGAIGLALAIFGLFGVLAIAARVGHSGRTQVVLGPLLGAIFGAGVGVLLQQFGVIYPTTAVAIGFVAAGAAVGFGLSLIGIRATPPVP